MDKISKLKEKLAKPYGSETMQQVFKEGFDAATKLHEKAIKQAWTDGWCAGNQKLII